MTYTQPQISDFKAQFVRDFPYGTNPTTSILDSDITNAFNYTNQSINPELFNTQTVYNLGYLLLSAHFLVQNIRQSSQGLSGQYNFIQSGKGAGGVSESFSIPQRILDNPLFSMYTKTNYGAQYLQLLLPQLVGQTFNVMGTTLP